MFYLLFAPIEKKKIKKKEEEEEEVHVNMIQASTNLYCFYIYI